MIVQQLEKHLTPTHFVLFYERSENAQSVADVPVQLPLKIAYMSAGNKIHCIDVAHISCADGTKQWQVQLGDDQPR